MEKEAVIQVDAVSMSYGTNKAIKQVSFHVKRGELFGIIGRNGAGKTTLLELLMGQRAADAGTITVLGYDVKEQPKELKDRISIFMQSTTLVDKLTVKEALDMLQGFYNLRSDTDAMLGRFKLERYGDKTVKRLSGGLRKRVMLAAALANDPDIIILDEPTTGLDMQAKKEYWEMLSELKEQGKTIVISSHDMSEIQRHCDRVGVMKDGGLAACGSPQQLIRELPGGGLTMEAVYMHYAVSAEGGVGI
jgi:ABC-type multidrug transport system, ATPase component